MLDKVDVAFPSDLSSYADVTDQVMPPGANV
jgi:hypothetical protein